MVTDGERRAAANTIRRYNGQANCMYLVKYAACKGDLDASESAFLDRLADLIEPEPERTCGVVTDKNTVSQTQEVHTKHCSECSYVFGHELHRQLLPGLDEEIVLYAVQIPDYCPGCGAKVTEVGQ